MEAEDHEIDVNGILTKISSAFPIFLRPERLKFIVVCPF